MNPVSFDCDAYVVLIIVIISSTRFVPKKVGSQATPAQKNLLAEVFDSGASYGEMGDQMEELRV